MESRKMNLFAGQQWRHRYKEQTWGKEDRLGSMERVTWKHITTCKIDNQWEFAVWFRELKLGLCNNLEGGMGREVGRRLKREGTHVYL